MKKNKILILVKNTILFSMSVLCLTTLLLACSKNDDNEEEKNSMEFCQAVIDDDQTAMIDLMEALTMDLTPTSTATDQLGHELNYNELIERLNNFSCLEASGVCYGCIETWPVQSEIKVMVDLNGVQLERVMDITTPEDGPLVYLRMHE